MNDRSVNINKVPHVTKTGPDRFLEKNLKRIICKVPQKHKTRIDPDSLLRKSLKKIVYGRLGLETTGVRRQGQSLKQKQKLFGGTFLGEPCWGNLGGRDVGGTLGSSPRCDLVRDVGGTFGDVGDISRGCRGNLGHSWKFFLRIS